MIYSTEIEPSVPLWLPHVIMRLKLQRNNGDMKQEKSVPPLVIQINTLGLNSDNVIAAVIGEVCVCVCVCVCVKTTYAHADRCSVG